MQTVLYTVQISNSRRRNVKLIIFADYTPMSILGTTIEKPATNLQDAVNEIQTWFKQ